MINEIISVYIVFKLYTWHFYLIYTQLNMWINTHKTSTNKVLALTYCNGCDLCLIPDAVMKWKAGLGKKEIESLIAETLKHAPAHIETVL